MSVFQAACIQPSFSLARRLFVLSSRANAKQIFLRTILQADFHRLVSLAIQIGFSSFLRDEVSKFHGKSFSLGRFKIPMLRNCTA